jgi:hypothetical protein
MSPAQSPNRNASVSMAQCGDLALLSAFRRVLHFADSISGHPELFKS